VRSGRGRRPADGRRRGAAGRRGDPGRRQRARGRPEVLLLGALSTSPDGRRLAYSTDFTGGERFTIRIKDLDSGEVLADEVPGAFYGCAWALDGSALFYVTVDDAWRPYRVLRHMVGTPAADDVVVYEEADERFWVGVGLTRSERYLHIAVGSKITSESWLLDAADPAGEFSVVLPRRQGVEYSVEHQLGATATGCSSCTTTARRTSSWSPRRWRIPPPGSR